MKDNCGFPIGRSMSYINTLWGFWPLKNFILIKKAALFQCVCQKKMYLEITQTWLTNTPFKGQTRGSLVWLAASVIAIWHRSRRNAQPSLSRTVYGQVRGCVCLVGQSEWLDGQLSVEFSAERYRDILYASELRSGLHQPDVFPINGVILPLWFM